MVRDDGRRLARVEREVQVVIANYLISGIRVPLPGLVTVAQVKMPADLRSAKVYVSVLGDDSLFSKAVDLLNSRAFEIQKYIGDQLKMRYCPKLTFYPDHSTNQILKVEKILEEIKSNKSETNE